jgi:hypothetical protein
LKRPIRGGHRLQTQSSEFFVCMRENLRPAELLQASAVPHKPPSLDPQLPLCHELPDTRPIVFKLKLEQPSIRLENFPGLQDGRLLLLEGKSQLHLSLVIEDDLALEVAPEVLEWIEDLVHGSRSLQPSLDTYGAGQVCGSVAKVISPFSSNRPWS